jgi:hypothetical protein
MTTAKTAFEYLSDLGAKVASLDQRISADQERQDNLAHDLRYNIDRQQRAQDRATVREYREFQRETAQEEAEGRTRAQADAHANRQTQAVYQGVLSAFNEQAPPPAMGMEPESYRRKLMRGLRAKLSEDDQRRLDSTAATVVGDLARMDGVDRRLRGPALDNIEALMLEAAAVQAKAPHPSTLPPAGEHVQRITENEAGQKQIEYHGRRSFIYDLTTPGRIVERIQNPDTGQVLYGPPYPRMLGR